MPTLSLVDLVGVLDDRHKYDTLQPKAKHKILYLIQKESESRGIELQLPYFWYQFGVVTKTAPTQPIHESQSVPESVVSLVDDILSLYYETSLEQITDYTYRDAPYPVYQHWRKLDKKLRTHHSEYHDFYEVDPSRGEIIDSIDAVYDTFPLSDFPNHEPDLINWYTNMNREINSNSFDSARLMQTNLAFWRSFCLSIAEKHKYNMSRSEVLETLDISTFQKARNSSREKLWRLEDDALSEHSSDSSLTQMDAATDSVMESILEIT